MYDDDFDSGWDPADGPDPNTPTEPLFEPEWWQGYADPDAPYDRTPSRLPVTMWPNPRYL